MGIAARLDEIGKPAWIALMVLSFIVFWPLGLVTLAFLIGSGRMACWKHRGHWRHGIRWPGDEQCRAWSRLSGYYDGGYRNPSPLGQQQGVGLGGDVLEAGHMQRRSALFVEDRTPELAEELGVGLVPSKDA